MQYKTISKKVEYGFSDLAGPYNILDKQEVAWMENVIRDMKAGNIEYRVVEKDGGHMVQRTGMVKER